MEIKLKGVNEVMAALVRKHMPGIKRAAMWGLYTEGLHIIRQAAMAAPVDTGRLRASHYVEPPVEGKETIQLGFGTAYAQRQNYEHKTARGYFTGTLEQSRRGREDRVAATARRILAKDPNGGGAPTSEPQSLAQAEALGVAKSAKRAALKSERIRLRVRKPKAPRKPKRH